jgi:hypothetical protein
MAEAISGGNSSSSSSSSYSGSEDGRSPTASFFGNSDLSTSRALASSTFLAGDEPAVILPLFSLPELLELTSGLFGPFHTWMDAVMPLRLATMLHRWRLARIVPPGWMDAGGGGRSGGDSRVTSGRQARSAESVAPIPDMVDDRKA